MLLAQSQWLYFEEKCFIKYKLCLLKQEQGHSMHGKMKNNCIKGGGGGGEEKESRYSLSEKVGLHLSLHIFPPIFSCFFFCFFVFFGFQLVHT